MKKRKRIYSTIGLLMIAALLSVYFYNQLIHTEIPIHSDDAGIAVDFRDAIDMGCARSYWFQPFALISRLLFYEFGATEFWIDLFFSVKYFICIALALIIALQREDRIEWWEVPLFVFFCMPGCFGTASIQPLKFHVWTIAVPLICLTYLVFRGDDIRKLKKWDVLIVMVLALYGIVEKDILIGITCWFPFVLYWCVYFVQKGYIKKYLKQIILCGIFVLAVGKAFFGMIQYQGYGASVFPDITVIFNNFKLGITGLLSMFNIDMIGNNVIQFAAIVWFLRLVLLVLAFISFGSVLKDIYRKKIENVSMVDAILAISGVVVVAAYLFGGAREDEISIRYATYLYYVLLILLCRKISEKIDSEIFVVNIRTIGINVCSAFFIVAIAVYMDSVTFVRDTNTKDILVSEMLQIEELEKGIGSFWNANVVSCLSDYQIEIQAGTYVNDIVEPYLQEWDSYESGNRNYNFFIEDMENDFGIIEHNLKETYGNYKEKYTIENSNIYVYDYDVRTAPLVITSGERAYLSKNRSMCVANNGNIKIKSGEKITIDNLYITSGKIRVIINGELELGKINISTEQGTAVEVVSETSKQMVCEIPVECLYEDFELLIANDSAKDIEIKSVEIARLENAVQLPNQEKVELMLAPGYYIFGMEGQDVKNSEMSFSMDGEEIAADRLNNGRLKVAYGLMVENAGALEIVTNVNGTVGDIYYQNEILNTINNPENTIYDMNHGIQINKEGTLLYGPYEELTAGEYVVDIYGQNLDDVDIYFTADGGTKVESVNMIQNAQEHYAYLINCTRDMSLFEVIISGIDNNDTDVYYYTIAEREKTDIDLIYAYDNDNVYTTGDKTSSAIILEEGELCFGPYVNLFQGSYELILKGVDLHDAEISLTIDSGQKNVDSLEMISKSENEVIYQFELEADVQKVEVVVHNVKEEIIELEQYTIRSVE